MEEGEGRQQGPEHAEGLERHLLFIQTQGTLACTVVVNILDAGRITLSLATKVWSPASSTGVTWELVRNALSHAPLLPYSIRI